MTAKEAFASLISLYKKMMFPENGQVGWTMSQIDEMDVHFFDSLFAEEQIPQEKEVYLSDVW
ncbi:hypothetical protein BkAM31D_21040 [Halalkalibacter krulwichiae]|uniref:Uncharacterized protein n=1 Tax=Halalkalibacter krulwichiae TaxID=199441 RepID=A0A1X9MFA9_9BACI|nr:hypothetical protein [Halalkalibacter krulwichiae]ARK32128.1 hypothetical protein BkAM31D_21040 [Halalkalibacter krulwichiae]